MSRKTLCLFLVLTVIMGVTGLPAFGAAVITDAASWLNTFEGIAANTAPEGMSIDLPVNFNNYANFTEEEKNIATSNGVDGLFGKDTSDTSFHFRTVWNGATLPNITNAGTAYNGQPYTQRNVGTAEAAKTLTPGDILHISFEVAIDNYIGTKRFMLNVKDGVTPTSTSWTAVDFVNIVNNANGRVTVFGQQVLVSMPLNTWTRFDFVIHPTDVSTVDVYVNGENKASGIAFDASTAAGVQPVRGLNYVRIFFNMVKYNNAYPLVNTYLDNLSYRVTQTAPVLAPVSLSHTDSVINSYIDNVAKTVTVPSTLTASAFLNGMSGTNVQSVFVVDEEGSAQTGGTGLTAGYVRILDNNNQNTYYKLVVNQVTAYTVTFVNDDGSVLKTEVVAAGFPATAPAEPAKQGHTFIGWDKPFNNITEDTTVRAQYSINSYTVTVNAGSNGTVTSDPENATVFYGQTVTFTIVPDEHYQIAYLKFDGNAVEATNGVYTTPALTKNAVLEIDFSEKMPVAPSITIVAPAHVGPQTFNGVSTISGKQANNLIVNSSFISYATISNPDGYALVSYGMYLKDVATGKVLELPALYKTAGGQFAVQVFGDGFIENNDYTLQAYLTYMDGPDTKLVLGESEKPFKWQL